jgi:putative addiction module CopG family antidote
MVVALDPQSEALIQQKVASGLYPDGAAVIREALRLLEEHDRLRAFRDAAAKGEDGEGIPFTSDLVEKLKRRSERMVREGISPAPDVLP